MDSPATFVAQSNVAGNHGYGKFSIDAAGAWTYTMNSAHNEFVGGHDYTDSITVKTADGTTQVITVTMHGSNDDITPPTVTITSSPDTIPNVIGNTSTITFTFNEVVTGFTQFESQRHGAASAISAVRVPLTQRRLQERRMAMLMSA